MARNGKIDSSGPNKAMNFLKKNVQTLGIDARIGRTVERDIVDFDIAKKACAKANIEGRIEGVNDGIAIVLATAAEQGFDSKLSIATLQRLKDILSGQLV